jgi:hypothetical protein
MLCAFCKKDTENPKFCSLSCSAKYNNKSYPKRTKHSVVCKTCDKSFPKNGRRKYCSEQCKQQAFQHNILNRINQTGCYYTSESKAGTRAIRKYLIAKHGNNCMICGLSGDNWNGKPITLIVDHINGHADDWSIVNIQLVCPNCDCQLPTYKGRNKGNSTRKYIIKQK